MSTHASGRLLAALGFCATLATAAQTNMTIQPLHCIRQHDSLILALEDSSLCDTCTTEDSRGVRHQAYADSGGVFYRHNETRAVRLGREWSPSIRLSRWGRASSPVIFELAEPGKEPLLVVMWRQMDEGRVRVWRCLHFRGVPPWEWSVTLDVTLSPK